MPQLSVVFTARERFALADQSLRTLFANCSLPSQSRAQRAISSCSSRTTA
jgi:hypothetical protein